MCYRKIWEIHHNTKIPDGYEIHHIDGNRNNNNIENLKCVSIEEHLEIHTKQQDWGAVQAILMRMDHMEGISEAASKFQKQLLENGNHNFQKMTKERRTEISKSVHQNRKTAFLGIEDTVENSRNAGLAAAEKNAGFLDTHSKNHGGNYVRGTKWWNDGNINKRSINKPGEEFVEGFLCKQRNIDAISQATKNTQWWINVNTGEKRRCSTSPGNEWKKGMKL